MIVKTSYMMSSFINSCEISYKMSMLYGKLTSFFIMMMVVFFLFFFICYIFLAIWGYLLTQSSDLGNFHK